MDEPTTPIVQPNMDEVLYEEGNYSRNVNQAKPHVVIRNHPEGGNDGRWCKYKDFIASKPPSLSGIPTPVEVMNWISEMEIVFESYNCSNKQSTFLIVRQLKTGVLSWWKLLANTMPKGEANNISC